MGYVNQAAAFLVRFAFDLYTLAVMLRFLLQWVRADFYNPISQFLVAVTNPPLRPLRRLIPGLWGVDWASVALLLALAAAKLYLLGLMGGVTLRPAGVLVWACGELLLQAYWILLIALFVRVVLSWVAPAAYHPAVNLVLRLTEPLMAPARQLIPPVGGLDLSILLVFLLLYLSRILLIQPLLDYGRALA